MKLSRRLFRLLIVLICAISMAGSLLDPVITEAATKRVISDKIYEPDEDAAIEIKFVRPPDDQPHIEVAIAVDTSNSMISTLRKMKEKLYVFSDKLYSYPGLITLSVRRISTSEEAIGSFGPELMTNESIPRFRTVIDQLTASGGTDVMTGMQRAFNTFSNKPNVGRYFIAVTDTIASPGTQCPITPDLTPTLSWPASKNITFQLISRDTRSDEYQDAPSGAQPGNWWNNRYEALGTDSACAPYLSQLYDLKPGGFWAHKDTGKMVQNWEEVNRFARIYNSPYQPFTSDGTDIYQNDVNLTLDDLIASLKVSSVEVNDTLNTNVFSTINEFVGVFKCGTDERLVDNSAVTFTGAGTPSFKLFINNLTFPEYCVRIKARVKPNPTNPENTATIPINSNAETNRVNYKNKFGNTIFGEAIERGQIKVNIPPPPVLRATPGSPVTVIRNEPPVTGHVNIEYVNPEVWRSGQFAVLTIADIVPTVGFACTNAVPIVYPPTPLANGFKAGITAVFIPSGAPTQNFARPSSADLQIKADTTVPFGNYSICIRITYYNAPGSGGQPVDVQTPLISLPIQVVSNPWLQISSSGGSFTRATGDVYSQKPIGLDIPQGNYLFWPTLSGVVQAEGSLNDLMGKTTTVANKEWLAHNYSALVSSKSVLKETVFNRIAGQVDRIAGDRQDIEQTVEEQKTGLITGAGCRSERFGLVDAVRVGVTSAISSNEVLWGTGRTGQDATTRGCPMFVQIGTAAAPLDLVIEDNASHIQSSTHPIVFVISGNLKIHGNIRELSNMVFMWNKGFDDAYNVADKSNASLTIKGALIALPGSSYGLHRSKDTPGLRRSNGDNTNAAEIVQYQPKLMVQLAPLFEGYDNILTWNEDGIGL